MDKNNPKKALEYAEASLHYAPDFVKDDIQVAIENIGSMIEEKNGMISDPKIIEMFKSINATNSIDDIFDICVIERNNWQMLGSCKPFNQTYKVSNIYKINAIYHQKSVIVKSMYL